MPQPYSFLPNHSIHKRPLHLGHFLLELLHLLPAIQRPSIIQTQAPNHIGPGALDVLIQVRQLLPGLEFPSEPLNLLQHRLARRVDIRGRWL